MQRIARRHAPPREPRSRPCGKRVREFAWGCFVYLARAWVRACHTVH
ncbi:hypothetical protein MYA_3838 [Burkholderia sp. KJ006]|nr:hypothetical protein MYA_3838 [Burkholderia sp. KJ006]